MIAHDTLPFRKDLTYKKESVQILDRKSRGKEFYKKNWTIRRKKILLKLFESGKLPYL